MHVAAGFHCAKQQNQLINNWKGTETSICASMPIRDTVCMLYAHQTGLEKAKSCSSALGSSPLNMSAISLWSITTDGM